MSRGRGRDYDPAFKLKVVARLDGGTNVSELSRELGIKRTLLYRWWDAWKQGGPDGLRRRGRPRTTPLPVTPPATASDGGSRPVTRFRRSPPRRRRWLWQLRVRRFQAVRPPPLRKRAGASRRSNARSASSSWNWIFSGKPCGISRRSVGRPKCGSASQLGPPTGAPQTVDFSRKSRSQDGSPSAPIEGHLMKRICKMDQCGRCSSAMA